MKPYASSHETRSKRPLPRSPTRSCGYSSRSGECTTSGARVPRVQTMPRGWSLRGFSRWIRPASRTHVHAASGRADPAQPGHDLGRAAGLLLPPDIDRHPSTSRRYITITNARDNTVSVQNVQGPRGDSNRCPFGAWHRIGHRGTSSGRGFHASGADRACSVRVRRASTPAWRPASSPLGCLARIGHSYGSGAFGLGRGNRGAAAYATIQRAVPQAQAACSPTTRFVDAGCARARGGGRVGRSTTRRRSSGSGRPGAARRSRRRTCTRTCRCGRRDRRSEVAVAALAVRSQLQHRPTIT